MPVRNNRRLFFVSIFGFAQMIVGTEWLIEASGCDATRLRDIDVIRGIFERVIADLSLKTVDSIWHTFPDEGGVTALTALTESHLACHTYPEHGTATFNLYCCRTRPEWNWDGELRSALGAKNVSITRFERGADRNAGVSVMNSR
jgi:S-adenosylmethionine decarboxylase